MGRAGGRRSYLMRCSVLALSAGVITLPLAFVALPGTGASASAVPEWPAPPSQIAEPELAQVRYQAEITEAARRRERAMAGRSDDTSVLLVLAAVGLLTIFGGAALGQRRATG